MRTHVRLQKWERLIRKLTLCLIAATIGAVLLACANKSNLVNHSIQFDARTDSPDVELLGWRYGTSRHPGARSCPDPNATCTKIGQQVGISGEMRVEEDLYVKWRVKSSGEIFEETVDLKEKLPRNIENHTIRFIANQSQLYVYLITPTKHIPNPCPPDRRRLILDRSGDPDGVMFSMYCSRVILRLHPVSGVVPLFN